MGNLKSEIIRDLKAFRERHGGITRDHYKRDGEYSWRKVYEVFGTWAAAMEAAELVETLDIEQLKESLKQEYIRIHSVIGKIPTWGEFLANTDYSRHRLDQAFPKFADLRAYCSGHVPNVPTKLVRAIDRHDVDNEPRVYIEELLSYNGKYNKSKNKKHKILMVCSDIHDKWVDPFALGVWLDSIKRIQPDYICFDGDIFDFYEVSTFDKDPRRIFALQKEIDFVVKKIFAPARKAAPNAQIDFLIGNHEFRLVKFLMGQAQALSSLRCMRFGDLFRLDEFKINLVCHDRFASNKTLDEDRNFKIYDGIFCVTHGTSTSNNHAMTELQKWGMSGCSGHVHHFQKAKQISTVSGQAKRNIRGELKWISMGCMCSLDSGAEYINDIVRWQQGFLIAHLFPDKGDVITEYVEIVDNKAVVGGKYYERG